MWIRLLVAALLLGLRLGVASAGDNRKPFPKPTTGPFNPHPSPTDKINPKPTNFPVPSVDVETRKLDRMINKRTVKKDQLALRGTGGTSEAETRHIICDDLVVKGQRPPQWDRAPKPTDSTKKWRDYILGNPTPKPQPKP